MIGHISNMPDNQLITST